MAGATGIIQSNGQPLLKTSPFPGGQGGSVEPQKAPSTGGKGGGAVQPSGPIANRSGGGMDFMQPANTGGNGILPPGSLSTSDMGSDGMSTTERNFIATHGKPFSEMTPEEQFAVQNPASTPRPMPVPPMMPQPLPTPGGFDVNQAAAGALQEAIGSTRGAMAGPLRVGQYMNPYQQAVIERTQEDIERQRQMAANQLGAQASAAGAFGGSRQGVAEGVLAGEYGRMGADIAAQQRQAGYSQAMQSAMADRAARLGAAQQLGGLGQQAFGTGQAIQQQQAQQGLLQQAMQQQLIDAARGQYQGYVGQPERSMALPLEALGISQRRPFGTTESAQPGLFSGLQFLSGLPGMFKGF